MLDNRRDGPDGLNGVNRHDGVDGHDGVNGHYETNGHAGANGYANGHKYTPVDISVATSPKDLTSVQTLLKKLNAGILNLTASNEINHELRQDLSTKARDIMLALETPRETSIKHIWGEVSGYPAVPGNGCSRVLTPVLYRREQAVQLLGVSTAACGSSWPATVISRRRSQTWPRSLESTLFF